MSNQPLLLRVFAGESVERPPVWFMRQAGRYLPEYQEVRKQVSMLDLIRTPELAAKVTLQPLDRFNLDAGIIFADILNPLIGMGIELDFIEGEGPKIGNLVKDADDIHQLRVPDPRENVGYTLEAIRMVTNALKDRQIPLLGFAGAPFTLAWYLMESSRGSGGRAIKGLMLTNRSLWEELQGKLTRMIVEYLVAQAEAGVAAVQLFDSWVGYCSPMQFDRFVAPHLATIIQEVRRRTRIPILYYANSCFGLYPSIGALGFDGISVDWRASLPQVAEALGRPHILQGNLDPGALFGSRELLDVEVRRILAEGASLERGHIMNLGHGILPATPIDSVGRVVQLVRDGVNRRS